MTLPRALLKDLMESLLAIYKKPAQKLGSSLNTVRIAYFMVGWCAKCAEWECRYIPESRVMHIEGASTGIRAASPRAGRQL